MVTQSAARLRGVMSGGTPTVQACISGLSTYLPPRTLTNADLEKIVDTNDEWILQRTGIRKRHIVDAGVATSDLAAEAARATPDGYTLFFPSGSVVTANQHIYAKLNY